MRIICRNWKSIISSNLYKNGQWNLNQGRKQAWGGKVWLVLRLVLESTDEKIQLRAWRQCYLCSKKKVINCINRSKIKEKWRAKAWRHLATLQRIISREKWGYKPDWKVKKNQTRRGRKAMAINKKHFVNSETPRKSKNTKSSKWLVATFHSYQLL